MSKNRYNLFLKVVMFHVKSKGEKCRTAMQEISLTLTPDLWGWVERSDIKNGQLSIFFIELIKSMLTLKHRMYYIIDRH